MHRNPEILPSDLDTLMAPFKFFISDKCRKSILTVTDVSTFQSICLTLLTTRISDAHSDSENYRSCDDVVKLDIVNFRTADHFFIGVFNCAAGLIVLSRLHLRPIQLFVWKQNYVTLEEVLTVTTPESI